MPYLIIGGYSLAYSALAVLLAIQATKLVSKMFDLKSKASIFVVNSVAFILGVIAALTINILFLNAIGGGWGGQGLLLVSLVPSLILPIANAVLIGLKLRKGDLHKYTRRDYLILIVSACLPVFVITAKDYWGTWFH